MIRILVIVPMPVDPGGMALRQLQAEPAHLRPSTEIVYRAVEVGPKALASAQDWLIVDLAILQAGINAEREGFDAICVDTMSDSGVAALRSVVKIPVLGAGLSAFTAALALGSKFSILALYNDWAPAQRQAVRDYALGDALASIRSIDAPFIDYATNGGIAVGDAEAPMLKKIVKAAECAIKEDGADVIIMASTTMYRLGLHLQGRIAAPVINGGPISYRNAEMFAEFKLSHAHDPAVFAKTVRLPDMLTRMVQAAKHAQDR